MAPKTLIRCAILETLPDYTTISSVRMNAGIFILHQSWIQKSRHLGGVYSLFICPMCLQMLQKLKLRLLTEPEFCYSTISITSVTRNWQNMALSISWKPNG